jgi:hypothetical protein
MNFFFEDHTKNPYEKYLAFLEADDDEDQPVNMEVKPDGRLHDYQNDIDPDEVIEPDTVQNTDDIDVDGGDVNPDVEDNAPDTTATDDIGNIDTDGEDIEPDTGDENPDTETDTTDDETEDTQPDETGTDDTATNDGNGDEIDVDGGEDDLTVDDDAPDEVGGEENTDNETDDGTGKTERTDESLLKYSLFLDMKKLYNAIKSYASRLEDSAESNINYGMVTKTCATNLHQIENMLYDFLTIRFVDESYVSCKLFYEKTVTSVGMVFNLLEQNSKLVN